VCPASATMPEMDDADHVEEENVDTSKEDVHQPIFNVC